jgi:multiple sugar transport system ATP-binding protein
MNVFDNLAFGLRRRSLPRTEIERRVRDAAATLGLADLLGRKPHALSGGQRQRVALGRAIVRQPKVFLFDEPLSNLDAALRVGMRGELARLHRDLAATMIYVTHDQVEAMTMGDRICIMAGGKVAQIGVPLEVYAKPATTFVATFLGSPAMNLVPARLVDDRTTLAIGDARLPVPEPLRAAASHAPSPDVLFGVRPEDLAPDGADAALPAGIVAVEPLGADTILRLKLSGVDAELLARVPRVSPARAGERVRLRFDVAAAHLFDPSTQHRL